ncbi:mitochondrial ribonuclease P protein 1 homolog [Pseudomyrmex gracilis]|uniref:mitochondrial ribonuclease P protein 1 homolog n=1 Tax=Pseudomyrmex gracilis TaxID=219809 RepID=UPI000995B701|nr:mitochondrial ribonuclease P protein 1 homolog [Pseudomyrmex gracilis]
MYNRIRQCLIVSVQIHRRFATQSNYEKILLERAKNFRVNTSWTGAACRRCMCGGVQNVVKKELVQAYSKEDAQRKLDEFLSDPENKKLAQIIELEIDVLRHNAEKVPNGTIAPREWLVLFKLETRSQRKKYLHFLWHNEKTRENKAAKKEAKKAEWLVKKAELEKKEAEEDTNEMKYGLGHNTIFMRIYESTMNNFYNGRVILHAMMYEPKIVFDCSYEEHMTIFEIQYCVRQLIMAFSNNRTHENPMFLYFCNFNKDGFLGQNFYRQLPIADDVDFPAVITTQSYLDLFPKEKLVYLTPHCRNDLEEFDPEAIYIIGAMVDKTSPKPHSLAKAKKEGIRMAKLPLEKYLEWGTGSTKSFTLNQMMSILLDVRHTKDWKKALSSHVPSRKLKATRDYMLQKKLQKALELGPAKPFNPEEYRFLNRKLK